MKYRSGEDFLNKLFQNLHLSPSVMRTALKSDTPEEKISKYLERLELIHQSTLENEHKKELLQYFYYDKYVIKKLPDNYIALIKRQYTERGELNKEINEEKLLKKVQEDQRSSLDLWLDYFIKNDANYPIWFRFYAFNGMLKLNSLDKGIESFGKRAKTTTEFYIELNPEALAKVYDTLNDEIQGKNLTDEEVEALEKGENFAKLYTFYLQRQGVFQTDSEIEGQWIKYDWHSDYQKLWQSLQGKNTGWCTAGKGTAKDHINTGDFYVYYTKDKNGDYTNPRIAIRMDGEDDILEVRGVGPSQNLENNMVSIAEEKLKNFKDYPRFKQKLDDMKYLTELWNKHKNNVEFTKQDIAFLYEIDHTIRSFGYQKDQRIKEIKDQRNNLKDWMYYFDCKSENIGLTPRDVEDREIIVYYGNLSTRQLTDLDKLKSIKMVTGFIDYNEEDASYLKELQCIGESALFRKIKSSKGLENLSNVTVSMYLNSIEDISNFDSLKSVGQYIFAPNYSEDYMESEEFLDIIKEEKERKLIEVSKKSK